MPPGRLVSSPKSTGRLQNGHGARFVGGFVRHTSVMHLRQKLWLHFVHARSMYGPRQIEHFQYTAAVPDFRAPTRPPLGGSG
jgi:hypothetical protein